MKLPSPHTLASLAFAAATAHTVTAAVVGVDSFNYADGSIAGLSGGTGWAYERTDEVGAPAQSASDWDVAFGTVNVVSGKLVTGGSGAIREFGGPTEGVGAGSNEREGAFRGSGVVYFGAEYTVDALLGAGGQWGGFSSYDFGAERVFFGMPGQGPGTRFFGIDESGVGVSLTSIPVVAGQTYYIVGAVDFDNDQLKLWVNPDGSDFDTGATSSADVTRAYTGTNWSSSVRLASGADTAGPTTAWDNLRAATTFADAIPEPSSALLLAAGAMGLARRRRRLV